MAFGSLSHAQELFLDRLGESDLAEIFYLTGGTALSAFYLHHRESEDLDFFSREPFRANEDGLAWATWSRRLSCVRKS